MDYQFTIVNQIKHIMGKFRSATAMVFSLKDYGSKDQIKDIIMAFMVGSFNHGSCSPATYYQTTKPTTAGY